MRRRRRQIFPSINTDVLLAEFMYYNKEKQIISTDKLKEIKKELLTTNKEKIFWTNEEFTNHNVGFVFFKKRPTKIENKGTYDEKFIEDESKQYDIYINIIELNIKFTTEWFNSLVDTIGNVIFLGFQLTEEQMDFLGNFTFDYKVLPIINQDELMRVFMSWDDLLNTLIITKWLEKYPETTFDEYIIDCKTLFNNQPKLIKYDYDNSRGYDKLYHFINIEEKRINNKNYRIALCYIFGGYNYQAQHGFLVVSEDDKEYNYFDNNRLAILKSGRMFFFMDNVLEINKEGVYIVNGEVFGNLSNSLNNILGGDNFLISTQIYRFFKDRETKSRRTNRSLVEETHTAINIQYGNLLRTGRAIKIENVFIEQNKIKVNEGNFILEYDETFINTVNSLSSIRQALTQGDARYNYNTLYENLLRESVFRNSDNYSRADFYLSFKVNNVEITVRKDGTRMKINNIFSRIEDVYHILSKAICFGNTTDFDKYVKNISYVGVEWVKMINEGLQFTITNPLLRTLNRVYNTNDTTNLYMRFSLLWDEVDRKDVYLYLNEKKWHIEYKGKFKQYFNMPHRTITLSQLKRELVECITTLTDEDLIEIVDNGIKEAQIIKEKGLKLVMETIKDVKAELTTIEIQGREIRGYLLIGRVTGSKFFIKENDLTVYKYSAGSWDKRCVVDDHTKNRIFEDRLANRLVNIYNEPSFITTIH